MMLSSPMILAFRILGLIAVAAIAVLSLVPGPARPHVLWTGSIEHVAAYFGAATLLCLGSLDSRSTTQRASAMRVGSLLTAYRGALEVAQLFVPGRGLAMLDWGADALGAWFGVALVWMLRRPVLAALR